MLVLSRKLGERIVIGGGIVVTLVKVGPNQARLGIEAPRDVKVYREELAGAFEQPHTPPVVGNAPPPRRAARAPRTPVSRHAAILAAPEPMKSRNPRGSSSETLR